MGAGGTGASGAAAGARVSVTGPSAAPRPGLAPRRPLIGWPRFVALLLRRCPPLIGGALAAVVRAQVSLPGPGVQRPLPEALEAPRRGRADALPSVTSLPPAVPCPERSRRGGRVGARCGAGRRSARRACESGGAGGAPRAPVQAGRLLLQPALIDSSALVYRGVAGLLSWQEGGEPGGEQRSHRRKQ